MAKDGDVMERIKLKAARLTRGLSQPQLAKEIGCSKEAISMWERGEATPQEGGIIELCKFFKQDPADLDLASELTESGLAMLREILKNKTVDRRQAIEILGLPAFAGIDLSTLSKPLVSPEEFLRQCDVAINACWRLLKHGDFAAIESTLLEYIPALSRIANQSSVIQQDAAALATQAKILQIKLATHNLDFPVRKLLCLEAVRFGEISGDSRLHMIALNWHGDTYVYCYRQPQKAIPIFNEALSHLNSDMLLNKSAIYSNLAIAYAQDKNEKSDRNARKMIEQARRAMPIHPEQDPIYQWLELGHAELDKLEGRMYLDLAERFPSGDYAQQAYDVFGASAGKQFAFVGGLSQTLLHKADAALAIGDLHEFARCLEQGIRIALEINSKKRKDEAMKVLHKAPESWKKEGKYQDLAEMF